MRQVLCLGRLDEEEPQRRSLWRVTDQYKNKKYTDEKYRETLNVLKKEICQVYFFGNDSGSIYASIERLCRNRNCTKR